MKILYGVQIHGQGHINRSAEMIRRLRARGHRVEVLTSGQTPPLYAEGVLGAFDHVSLPLFAMKDGSLMLWQTGLRCLRLFPRHVHSCVSLAKRLTRHRFDLVISDFEPVSAWAAGLARMPSAGIAAQYRMTHTDAPGVGTVSDRLVPELATRACGAGLTKLFAVSFWPLNPTHLNTRVVGPIVGSAVRALQPKRRGFYLAYLYSYSKRRVLDVLGDSAPFRVYGLGAGETEKGVEFCGTSRDNFLRDLADCEGVVLNGSFQGACEASVLGKSVLSIPFANHYEERFCADQVARSGLGVTAPQLDRSAISRFVDGACPAPIAAMDDGGKAIIEELSL